MSGRLVLRKKTSQSSRCWVWFLCCGTVLLVVTSPHDLNSQPREPDCAACFLGTKILALASHMSPEALTIKTAALPKATFSMAVNVQSVIFNLSGWISNTSTSANLMCTLSQILIFCFLVQWRVRWNSKFQGWVELCFCVCSTRGKETLHLCLTAIRDFLKDLKKR